MKGFKYYKVYEQRRCLILRLSLQQIVRTVRAVQYSAEDNMHRISNITVCRLLLDLIDSNQIKPALNPCTFVHQ